MKKSIVLFLALMCPVLVYAGPHSFTDINGNVHALENYKGKWVLINLWATWCAPCLTEMPELQSLSIDRKDLVVLGIAVDEQNANKIRNFTEKLKVTYPIIQGEKNIAQQFKARGFPTSILYDKNGDQVLFKEGIVTRKDIEKILDR